MIAKWMDIKDMSVVPRTRKADVLEELEYVASPKISWLKHLWSKGKDWDLVSWRSCGKFCGLLLVIAGQSHACPSQAKLHSRLCSTAADALSSPAEGWTCHQHLRRSRRPTKQRSTASRLWRALKLFLVWDSEGIQESEDRVLPEATCGGWYVTTSGAELTLNCTAPGWLGDGMLKLLRLHFQTPNCFVFSEHACDLILASYAIAMHGCSKPFLGIAHGGFGTASPKCLI